MNLGYRRKSDATYTFVRCNRNDGTYVALERTFLHRRFWVTTFWKDTPPSSFLALCVGAFRVDSGSVVGHP